LLDTRLLSHLSRDTAATRTHCTRSVLASKDEDALFLLRHLSEQSLASARH
jgi:hypothetical protein